MDVKALRILSEIGTALSSEPDINRLMEKILLGARELTNADGATLYNVEDGFLKFAIIQSKSLNIDIRDANKVQASFPSIPLYDEKGNPNNKTVATFCVLNDAIVNIPDAYTAQGFDFAGTKEFDQKLGYRSQSFLTVPIKDGNDRVIAALQLINSLDSNTNSIKSFSEEDQRLVESLASQASVTLERHRLAQYKNAIMGSIVIRDRNSEITLSKAHLVSLFELCGLSHQMADWVAVKILSTFVENADIEISINDFHTYISKTLESFLDKRTADRFRAWIAFKKSGLPLIILIGGCSGTGKSTIAAELSINLDIGRIQSTDILREVMRLLISKPLAPELHFSSYDAWRAVEDQPHDKTSDNVSHLIEGFRAQVRKVSLAINGVLLRSVKERVSTIIEGIHIHPAFHYQLPEYDAIIVPVLLAIPDPNELKTRFKNRAEQAPSRRSDDYLKHFESIWKLQSHFISEAKRHDIPVIPNIKSGHTVRQLLEIVTDTLVTRYPTCSQDLFS